MREEDDAPTQVPEAPANPTQGVPPVDPRSAPANAAPGPTAAPPQPGPTQQQQQPQHAPQPPPGHPQQQYQHAPQPPLSEAAMFMQFAQMMMQSMQQSNQRMESMMGQQAAFMNHVLTANVQAQRRSHQKKGNPPTFDGKPSEEPDHWVYSTEKYYSTDCQEAMEANTSEFTTLIYPNLGPVAQAFFHELEMSMLSEDGSQRPISWSLFKTRFRERFREKDFEFKLLTKLYSLHPSGTQQEYTTRFLYLLSQLPPLPEFVKRWLYQQNLRAETSAFVSQNVPQTLSEVIELAQRFEDAQRNQPGRQTSNQNKTKTKTPLAQGDKKTEGSSTRPTGDKWCSFCSVSTHATADCRKKKAAEAAAAGGKREAAPKNG